MKILLLIVLISIITTVLAQTRFVDITDVSRLEYGEMVPRGAEYEVVLDSLISASGGTT
ncbi:MAG: hypothetical protein PHO85_04435 [Candidatus Cloacimonetes bacterium]|nr:hypothetical protein [Candidatus Cloacimonadota bacterium]MDD2506911.1 hypothetical protein [Candidatus Cloacimonadota bacterium]MDD4147748.1 hypothetical protein [Candidatus Cloacimonadota bacterium]MDD4560433.1 hypothetical protein [Candidatus Cloacimonadota bacterium]